jgi:hypothetical protein
MHRYSTVEEPGVYIICPKILPINKLFGDYPEEKAIARA